MKKILTITVVAVALICIFIFLNKKSAKESDAQQMRKDGFANTTKNDEQPNAIQDKKINGSAETSNSPASVAQSKNATKTNLINPQLLQLWQAPIEFYGKTVDENNNPLSDVKIHFQWSELPDENGMRASDAKSDSGGLFSLHGKHGSRLTVSFGKEGYYYSRSGTSTFTYSLGNDIINPDSQNPVIFRLKKKGEQQALLRADFPSGIGQTVQLRHDGTPVEIDLFKNEKVSAGNGQLKLEFWRDLSDRKAAVFDWKLQLSAPGGGLVETDEEFAFEAPSEGYQPSIVVDMPVKNGDWKGEIRNKYYIRLPNGDFGVINLYLYSYNGVFTIQSLINPSGSRNLEPK